MKSTFDPALEAGLSRAFVVGDALRQTLRVLKRDWPSHLALVAAAHLPWLALVFAPPLHVAAARALGEQAVAPLAMALAALGVALASTARLHMAGAQLAGEPASARASLAAIAPRSAEYLLFWAFCALALVWALVLYRLPVLSAFGMMWPIPGVAFATVYLVATPAQVIEGRGPLDSLRRSDDLTRPQRWEVFGFVITAWFAAAATAAPLFLFDAVMRAVALHRLRVAAGEIAVPDAAKPSDTLTR
jgi:hypothetical protein